MAASADRPEWLLTTLKLRRHIFRRQALHHTPDRRNPRNTSLPVCCRSLPCQYPFIRLLNVVISGYQPADSASPINMASETGPAAKMRSPVGASQRDSGRPSTMPAWKMSAFSRIVGFVASCDEPSLPSLADLPTLRSRSWLRLHIHHLNQKASMPFRDAL
jgi:hypothetical protein